MIIAVRWFYVCFSNAASSLLLNKFNNNSKPNLNMTNSELQTAGCNIRRNVNVERHRSQLLQFWSLHKLFSNCRLLGKA